MTETVPRTPAPGSLALVQKFINSTEMPDGVDELRTAAAGKHLVARRDRD